MTVWDKKTLCGFLFLLAGALGQTVIYEEPACAVKGSTVTLPCSFTPPKAFSQRRGDVPLELVRVLWYQSQWHQRCHLTKPFVFDSDSKANKQRFEYLGDKTTNCTLQITDVQERDEATFCFSMKINHTEVHFTKSRGVTVRVVDGIKMKIISSSEDIKFSRGETVTLLCTSVCTFHQLEVTWFRDGHALSESGPSLHLSLLTAEDSGNYICALKANLATFSEPYSLQVEAGEDATKMRIFSSSEGKKFSTGETVTLLCTSAYTFRQLEVTWFKDGHALSGTDPFRQFGPLTAEDSGNYICALKANLATFSEPYSLQVVAQEGVKLDKVTAVRLVLFAVHTLLIIIVASVTIKGRAVSRSAAGQQQRAGRHLQIQPSGFTEELRTNEEEETGLYHH